MSNTNTIEQLNERLKVARLLHEESQLKAETALIEGAVFPGMHVPEPMSMQEAWGDTVPQSDFPAGERDRVWGMSGRGMSIGAELGDRRHGSNRIAYEDESALARIRAMGRYLADCSANGQAVLENLTSYILGTGFGYKVVGEDGQEVDETLIGDVQAVVNEFLRDNKWTLSREEELFRRAHRDGEYFLALYHFGDGRVQARVLEPEQFCEPADQREMMSLAGLADQAYDMSYGVVTDAGDLEKIHGYTARFFNDTGRDSWTFFPASRMVHCRRNVDSNIKRGISDFFAVYEQLIDAAKLLRNTARGHAIMSAIAFIREHGAGVSQAGVESMRSGGAWANYSQVTRTEGSRNRTTHFYQPGTIVDVPNGQKYQASPMAQQGVGAAMVTVENAILRIAGTKWSMPSYMITGDTNANYAATLVTESPFVKFCQRQQKWHKEHFVDLLWKVLRIAHAAGRIGGGMSFDELQRRLNIKVDCPIVHSRDRNIETNRRKILRDSGVLSLETWAAEEGYDFVKEQALGAVVPGTMAAVNTGDQPGAPVEDQPFAGMPQAGHEVTGQKVPVEQQSQTVAVPAAASAAPGATAANLTTSSSDTLNGAQVSAAIQIFIALAQGTMVRTAATELLVGIGLERGRADRMVADTVAAQGAIKAAVQAEQSAGKPAVAQPNPLSEAARLLWSGYPAADISEAWTDAARQASADARAARAKGDVTGQSAGGKMSGMEPWTWTRQDIIKALDEKREVPAEAWAENYEYAVKRGYRDVANEVLFRYEKENPPIPDVIASLRDYGKSIGIDLGGKNYKSQGGTHYLTVRYPDDSMKTIRVGNHGGSLQDVNLTTLQRPEDFKANFAKAKTLILAASGKNYKS